MLPAMNIITASNPQSVAPIQASAFRFFLGLAALSIGCQTEGLPAVQTVRTETLTSAATTLVVKDVEFYFPEGTFLTETDVTFRVAAPASVVLPVGRARAVNMVEVLPHDLTLLRPIQIRSPSPAISAADIAAHTAAPKARLLQAHHLPSNTAPDWLEIDADFQEGEVRLKSTKAGRFTVSVPVDGCEPVEGCFTGISQRHCEPEELLDLGCGPLPDKCGDDEVITIDDDGCPRCSAAISGPATCAQAEDEVQKFFARVIDRTCSNPCENDGDCAAFRMEGACGDGCYSFNAYVDDEPMHAFINFAQQRCGVCGGSEAYVKQVGYGECLNSQCHFPEEFAALEGQIRF